MAVSMEGALYTKLDQDSTVSGLVSGRIYRMVLPQSVSYPAISFQQVSGFRDEAHDGATDPVEGRWQVDCWDDTAEDCRVLADAARESLHSQTGTWGSATVRACHFLSNRQFYDDEARIYRRSLDFEISHDD